MSLSFLRYDCNAFIRPDKLLRIPKLFRVFFRQIKRQAQKLFRSKRDVADEKISRNNLDHLVIGIIDPTVQRQSVYLAFLIVNYSNLIFKWHIFLNIATYKCLHCFKRIVDLNDFWILARLNEKYGNGLCLVTVAKPFAYLCLIRLKGYFLKSKAVAEIEMTFSGYTVNDFHHIGHGH